MLDSLENKLQKFDPKRPYIWELKITENEFHDLEDHVKASSLDASERSDALKIVVYMAEWYKRRYTNSSKKGYQSVFGGKAPDLEQAWDTLEIDKRYLYTGESGQNLYTYSTFILSGLAIRFELQKNEKPFLKALCRVYNNEDDSFDRIIDSNHSIAFKESIANKHCLYDFIDAIIMANEEIERLPFSVEDINDASTQIKTLVELIKNINAEIRKSKFRLEWIIQNPSGENIIVRYLRLWQNPEEKGKLHHLLKTDRLKQWGFRKPEEMRYIEIGMRFLNEEHVIQTIPEVMYYRNTGNPEVGFIAECPSYAVCNDVPICKFNRIQIISYENGVELDKPILEESVDFETMQVYQTDENGYTWTSRVNSQNETSVLFSENWNISDNSAYKEYEVKKYYNSKYGEGDSCRWSFVPTSVTLEDDDEVKTFYNRQGTIHLLPNLHGSTIHYNDEGKVNVYHYKDEELVEDRLFLIQERKDISAIKTECNEEDRSTSIEDLTIESYEYKDQTSGRYNTWSDDESPNPGYNTLRLTINGQPHIVEVFYAPDLITRNLEENTISYFNYDANGKVAQIYSDKEKIEEAKFSRVKLEPTVTLDISSETVDNQISYAKIQVYRPVELKEVSYFGKPYMYNDYGKLSIPYILRYGIEINVFGECGHRRYLGEDSENLYIELAEKNMRQGGQYQGIDDVEFEADGLPGEVSYIIRKSFTNNNRLRYLYWDFKEGTKPQSIRDAVNFKMESRSVIFQEQCKISENIGCEFKEQAANPFARNNSKLESIINIFLTAVEFNQYFFYFSPLREFVNGISNGNKDFWKEIYEPLINLRNYNLSAKDKAELLRFTDEFLLDEIKLKLTEKFKTNNI